jgi:uncharacterized membrane protein YsdA (DUF1294 family)
MERLPQGAAAIVAVYALMSFATLLAFAFDKQRAASGGRRISERTLHALELLGGWPGALLGQQLFRHKRNKPAFFLVTWLIAILHAGGWIAWISLRTGR